MIDKKIEDSVAILTLNRPNKYNAVNSQLAQELQAALDECEDEAIRCILITGSGKAFCSGQDLNEAVGADAMDIDDIVEKNYNPIVKKIRTIEKPVVAAVNGIAAGAGANLALCCDIVFAAKSAVFIQAFSKIGLIPDTAGSWILPRLVGMGRAAGMMMFADKISANQAYEMGMIYQVLPDEYFLDTVKERAQFLASMPTRGLGLTKRALNAALSNSIEDQLSIEAQIQSLAFNTEDCQEGIKAFQEKRKPVFTGK